MNNSHPTSSTLSTREFNRLSEFIHTNYGIKMPVTKKTMLQARLQKRLRQLDLNSYSEYCDLVLTSEKETSEVINMIDVVTTNKTDFFREPAHFDYLNEMILPDLLHNKQRETFKKLLIWSAGCSTGEEPYTLAMVLKEFAEKCPGFHFSILATDLSTTVLEKAKVGIYEAHKVEPVPMAFKKKYLLRSKNRQENLVRIAPELRSLVTFHRLNFMQPSFGLQKPVDIIFCRNVIIYFDRETQEKIVNRLSTYLKDGGYLFLGHSETLFGLDVPLKSIAPTIYKKQSE